MPLTVSATPSTDSQTTISCQYAPRSGYSQCSQAPT
ncbi:Uncharacterised protein [Bordetella pertussis]|nr:Uncharacterised protein [Bordetella pertussis]CFP65576.1 Uncharacterised protein [Bordetella pertussis]